MSGDKDKLEQLFQEALAGQEKLHGAGETPANGEPAAEEEVPIVEDTPAAEPTPTAESKPTAAPKPAAAPDPAAAAHAETGPGATATGEKPAKKTATEVLTEALIKAKQEAIQALEQTQIEAKSLHDRLLRVSADFDNFRKRSKKQTDDAVKFANEGLLRELLPGLDAFDRALAAIGAEDKSSLAQGIQMVHRMFSQIFGRIGLQPFSAVGEAFDPNRHEAVEQLATAEHPAGMVVREYQKGYQLHERLLRPATVVVSVGLPAAAPPADPPAADPPPELAADELQAVDGAATAAADAGSDAAATTAPETKKDEETPT